MTNADPPEYDFDLGIPPEAPPPLPPRRPQEPRTPPGTGGGRGEGEIAPGRPLGTQNPGIPASGGIPDPGVGEGYKVFPGGRPLYETKETTRNELEIATAVTHHLGLSRLWKLNPHSYGLDFALRHPPQKQTAEIVGRGNDEVFALLEAKGRKKRYPSWLISALKAARAAEFTAAGLRVFFAWGVDLKTEWEVYLWEWNGERTLRTFILAGRRDRNDPDDIEPMLVVPRERCVTFSALRSRAPLAPRDSFSL